MRPRRALIITTAVAALVGCNKPESGSEATSAPTAKQNVANSCRDVDPARMPDPAGPRPPGGYTRLAERDSLLRQIDAGEQKWRSGRPASYQMLVVPACFCRDRGQPIQLVVRGDSVIASRDTTGQQSWPDDWRTGLHVAGLFREAKQFVCDSTRTTRLTFDPALGYPTLLRTESRLGMSDTDREYRVLSFEADSGGR
jgi:hypothetical protein